MGDPAFTVWVLTEGVMTTRNALIGALIAFLMGIVATWMFVPDGILRIFDKIADAEAERVKSE